MSFLEEELWDMSNNNQICLLIQITYRFGSALLRLM